VGKHLIAAAPSEPLTVCAIVWLLLHERVWAMPNWACTKLRGASKQDCAAGAA